MLEEDRECSEILIQISAVRGALNNAGRILLKDHINHCVVEAIKDNNVKTLEELDKAIDKFIR